MELEEDIRTGKIKVDSVPLPRLLTRSDQQWMQVDGIRLLDPLGTRPTTPQNRRIDVELINGRAVAMEAPTIEPLGRSVRGSLDGSSKEGVLAAMKSIAEPGSHLYVGVNRAATAINMVVLADQNGRVAFVGECQYRRATLAFDSYVRSQQGNAQRSPEATLLRIVSNPAGEDAKAMQAWASGPPRVAWEDLPSDGRAYDPDAMPPTLLEQLKGVPVMLAFPASWRDRTDLTLCTKTPLFWGDCVTLGAFPEDRPIKLVARVRPGDSVEVWVLDGDARFDNPIARAFVMDPNLVTSALETGIQVTLGPADDVKSLDELVRGANAGREALVRR